MQIVMQTKPDGIGEYFDRFPDRMVPKERPFFRYIRDTLKSKGISEKDVFRKAELSDGYGYKLIAGEKKIGQRDVIIRLCLAMHMDVRETKRALNISGFVELSPDVKRDVILLVAINNGIYELDSVNKMLAEYGELTLSRKKGD